MRGKRISFWIYLCVSVVGVLLLNACVPQITSEPPALDEVSLQLQWVTQAQFAGYYVALEKGWYEEAGIDLTIESGGPDLLPVDLVTSGVHDFGTGLLADLALSIENGKPVISIAQIQQQNGLLLLAHKASGIVTPEDFVGKRVGVWLGSWEAQFDALIAQSDLDMHDFETASQGWSMEPFLAGELDVASAMIYNEYYVVLESGVSADDITTIDYADYGLDFPGDILFTTKEVCEQNPDLCTRMVQASLRGWTYAIEHPEEAAEIVLKHDKSGVQTYEHQLSMMREIAKLVQLPLRPLGYTNRDDVVRMIDALSSYNVLSAPVSPDDVYTNEFWEKADVDSEE